MQHGYKRGRRDGWGTLIGKSFFGGSPAHLIEFFNRLNSGNPNYRPYQTEKDSTDGR